MMSAVFMLWMSALTRLRSKIWDQVRRLIDRIIGLPEYVCKLYWSRICILIVTQSCKNHGEDRRESRVPDTKAISLDSPSPAQQFLHSPNRQAMGGEFKVTYLDFGQGRTQLLMFDEYVLYVGKETLPFPVGEGESFIKEQQQRESLRDITTTQKSETHDDAAEVAIADWSQSSIVSSSTAQHCAAGTKHKHSAISALSAI